MAMTPSPNLIAAVLAATTENAAIALCGNSLALYNPPHAGGRGAGDARLPLRRPADRRHGVRDTDGQRVLLRRAADRAARPLLRSTRADPTRRGRRASRSRSTASTPSCATSTRGHGRSRSDVPIWIPGSGSLETWELVNEFDYCYGYLSFSGKKARAADRQRVLGLHRRARRQHEPEPHGVHADHLLRGHATRRRSASTPTRSSTSTARTRWRSSSPHRPAT